jgi:ceramide glucosyltransferase
MWIVEQAALVSVVVSFVAYGVVHVLFLVGTRSRPRAEVQARPVSILKPLAGADDDLEANLESFACLRGDYEVLLGVASVLDPARAIAERVVRRHPDLFRLVATDGRAAMNPKVAQLVGLAREASGELLVVSDSNVRVRPDYLDRVLEASAGDRVGLVSCLVAGAGERTVGAALENVLQSAHVAPGIAAAYALTGRAITIGKSLAISRTALDRVGGFEAFSGVLAEDHALARRVSKAGLEVRIVTTPVENVNATCSIRRSLERHGRWAKIRRAMVPSGFAFELLLNPIAVATVALALHPSRVQAVLLAVALVVQTLLSRSRIARLRGKAPALRYAPVEVLASYLLLFSWLRACVSRRVVWRGHPFRIGAETALTPIELAETAEAVPRD